MDMWCSRAPDGREVVIRREGRRWKVRCGRSRAESNKLEDALIEALRTGPDSPEAGVELAYPNWIRRQADALDDPADDGSGYTAS
jgi:hypothetical protein